MKLKGPQRVLYATLIFAAAGQATAAGFQSTTHSAAGVGRANAGEAVIADTAAVLGRNPAAMMYFDRPIFTGGLNLVAPYTEVTDVSSNSPIQVTGMPDEDVSSVKPSPHLYYIHPLNHRVALGGAVYSNFATGTDFSDDFNKSDPLGGGGLTGGKTDVTTINLNVSVAVRIIEPLSLGLGLDVLYGSGTFDRPFYLNGVDSGLGLNFEGDGWSAGWDAGLMYEINDRNRLGLSYHSGMEFTAKGDGSAAGVAFDETKLSLPARSEFSGFHQVADAWAVHYSIQWIGWSAFDTIDFGGVTEKVYNWENTGRYAIGTTYTIGSAWSWRAGIAFDESPVPEEYRTISIPDSHRIWWSTGATWQTQSEHHAIDMAFTYIQGEKLEVNEPTPSPFGVEVSAETATDAIIIGASYNYRF